MEEFMQGISRLELLKRGALGAAAVGGAAGTGSAAWAHTGTAASPATTAIITGILETKRIGRLQERLSTGITDKRQSKLEATR